MDCNHYKGLHLEFEPKRSFWDKLFGLGKGSLHLWICGQCGDLDVRMDLYGKKTISFRTALKGKLGGL